MKSISNLNDALYSDNDKEKGRARFVSVLEWILRWRCTTPAIIALLLQITGNHHYAVIKKLENAGFIRRVNTADPRFRQIILITRSGFDFLLEHIPEPMLKPITDPEKIANSTTMHNLATQFVLTNFFDSTIAFLSDFELHHLQKPGEKTPDFAYIRKTKNEEATVGVEIELTRKSRALSEIAFSFALRGLANGNYDHYAYFGPSSGILAQYVQLAETNFIPEY